MSRVRGRSIPIAACGIDTLSKRYDLLNHTVMPNLKRLGVITELTLANYDKLGLLDESARHGSRPIPGVSD